MLAALSAGCGHTTTDRRPNPTAGTTGPQTSQPAPPPVPATSGRSSAGVLTLTERDNAHSFTVRPDATIIIVLHSTYWSIRSPSNPAVLEPQGLSVVVPQFGGCVPGQGCGTITTHYRARQHGRTQLTAQRQTCGEAMLCAPNQRTWHVTLTIN